VQDGRETAEMVVQEIVHLDPAAERDEELLSFQAGDQWLTTALNYSRGPTLRTPPLQEGYPCVLKKEGQGQADLLNITVSKTFVAYKIQEGPMR